MSTVGSALAELLGSRGFLAASTTKAMTEMARSAAVSSVSTAAANSIAKATMQMSEQTRAQLTEMVKPSRFVIPPTVLTALQASGTQSRSTARMLSGMQTALASTALPAANASWARVAAEMSKVLEAQQSGLQAQVAAMVAPSKILAETTALAKLQAQLQEANTLATHKLAPVAAAAVRLKEKQSQSITRAMSDMHAALASLTLPVVDTSWAKAAAEMSRVLQAQQASLHAQVAAMVAPSKILVETAALTKLQAQLPAITLDVADGSTLLFHTVAKPSAQVVDRARGGEQLPEVEEIDDAAGISAYWLGLACALVVACAIEHRSSGALASAWSVLWMLFELVGAADESLGGHGAIVLLGFATTIHSITQARKRP